MKLNPNSLLINSERMRRDFEELARIGATTQGGVHRPALSEAHLEARRWFRDQVLAGGLQFHTDSAGNHSAVLPCASPGAPSLLLGSHLDSVPDGGRFDGALGVLAALEALRVVKEAGFSLPVNLEAIDFTDEEGTLVGLLGSAAIAGKLSPQDLLNPRGGRNALLAALERAGLSEEGLLQAARPPGSLAGYLELHIEQGPRLVREKTQIGVVTAIVGIASYQVSFVGRADHAGATSMQDRLDAAQGAAAFILSARQITVEHFHGCVCNVGAASFAPGAYNIVPARVELALEFRAPDAETFSRLESALLDSAQEQAARSGLGLEIEFRGKHQPTVMESAVKVICDAAADLGLSYIALPSGAGHDAQSLAGLCPVGMIFVPSEGGASHSPREYTPWEDCVNGANVLLHSALKMASSL